MGCSFDLEPFLTAASFVAALAALGEDAFQSHLAGRFEHGVAIRDEFVRITDGISGLQYLFQKTLAFVERDVPQIVAVEIQEIEQKERGGSRARKVRDAVRIGDRNAGLDEAET